MAEYPVWVPLGWRAVDPKTHAVEPDETRLDELRALSLEELIVEVLTHEAISGLRTRSSTWSIACNVRRVQMGDQNPEPPVDHGLFRRCAAVLASLERKRIVQRLPANEDRNLPLWSLRSAAERDVAGDHGE